MSRDDSVINNNQRELSKVDIEQYLRSSDEPQDNNSNDVPTRSETNLLEKSPKMRLRFRRVASKLRKSRSDELVNKRQSQSKRHYAELKRIDDQEMLALDAQVVGLKLEYNAKRLEQDLAPIT